MFLILNIRNILDNFLRYGIQFGQTPTAFVPVNYIIALGLLAIFPVIAFGIEKLKFKNILTPVIAVINLLSLEIDCHIESYLSVIFKHSLLFVI